MILNIMIIVLPNCRPCVNNEFNTVKECYRTGFISTDDTPTPCIPEYSTIFYGFKIFVVLLALTLITLYFSNKRKQLLVQGPRFNMR